ncbi:hypothetical protein SDC9_154499 [bioreactor metagenome]|uniref:Uncharacterized protein n=1 Tax=bioreactor metagenome TaxID=1076179 RepID=A0A645F3T1_9ZZZZ
MQDILGGDGLTANPALGKRNVLGNGRIEVVAYHQHVQMLVDGVDGERPGGIGR